MRIMFVPREVGGVLERRVRESRVVWISNVFLGRM